MPGQHKAVNLRCDYAVSPIYYFDYQEGPYSASVARRRIIREVAETGGVPESGEAQGPESGKVNGTRRIETTQLLARLTHASRV